MKIHEHGYWLEDPPVRFHDVGLLEGLRRLFDRNHCVLDLGCGDGWYVVGLRDAGIMAYGVDGRGAVGSFLFTFDLTKPLLYPVAWTLSIEVGEHIPIEYADVFLDNVVNNAWFGSVLSWAVPGQGGVGHVNEQPNEWVEAEMRRRGMDLQEEETAKIRAAVSGEAPWLRQSLMAFRRENFQ